MTDQQPAPKPEPGITLIDGCIGWPVSHGGLIRIDPFHIAAFGIAPAQNPAAENGVEAQGWAVWVSAGDGTYTAFYKDKRKAVSEFLLVQAAKVRH